VLMNRFCTAKAPRPQEDGKAQLCLKRLERMATGVTGENFATGAAVC
jgi:hypothetical protein